MKARRARSRPARTFTFFCADLMQQSEVRRVADEVGAYLAERDIVEIDALILNAGCVKSHYGTTAEGYEQQFALNFLSGVLHDAPASASAYAQRRTRALDGERLAQAYLRSRWEDVMLQRHYNPLFAYKQTKLCAMLFARAFNSRFQPKGVRMYVIDPRPCQHRDRLQGYRKAGCTLYGHCEKGMAFRRRSRPRPTPTSATGPSRPKGCIFTTVRLRLTRGTFRTTAAPNGCFIWEKRLCGIQFEEEPVCSL